MSVSGGCQCGAVRFRVDGEVSESSICHCRMCQKAMGGLFGPFVGAKIAELVWTRGERKRFQSSNKVWRGFCGDCGTPLTFEYHPSKMGLALGALDDPAPYKPEVQFGSENEIPWAALPGVPRQEADDPAIVAHQADLTTYQHPDHDTESWEPHR